MHETADQAHLNSSMDLDLDNDPNIIETKPPPPIFIHTVNDFASFCAQIKEITKMMNSRVKVRLMALNLPLAQSIRTEPFLNFYSLITHTTTRINSKKKNHSEL